MTSKRREYTEVDRYNIMRKALAGETYREIGKLYGVSKSAIAGLIYRINNPEYTNHH